MIKLNHILIAYYMEIIANSSHGLRNMGIYSQVTNMVWIRGIWITPKSESIISQPNKDKLPITIVQRALKRYPGFKQSQNMRGVK
jgi:hypothetical protein